MFDTEPYRGYVALCRTLRLERVAQPGDWAVSFGDRLALGHSLGVLGQRPPFTPAVVWPQESPPLSTFWIPRSDQLDDMLEAAGVLGVVIERLGAVWFATDRTPDTDREGYARRGATREEAKLRLWLAVTGRAVTG